MNDHYATLGLEKGGTTIQQVKARYKKLVLSFHPDRVLAGRDRGDLASTDKWNAIVKAYECLSDPVEKKNYDAELEAFINQNSAVIHDHIDLDDMDIVDDDHWSLACRCGGRYAVSYEDLEDGIQLIPCDTCSLCIRLLYSVSE